MVISKKIMYLSLKEIRKKYIDSNRCISLKKPKYSALESEIVEIFNGNMLKYELEEYKNNDNINFMLGLYYQYEEMNYDKMKCYYELAISLNNDDAMLSMGWYYNNIGHDYDKMKYFYEASINLNNDDAMTKMGSYYQNREVNYDKMKYYYGAAISLNNSDAMSNMGIYYRTVEINYDKMKYYYSKAILLNNNDAMFNMGWYYLITEKNYNLRKHYFELAIINNYKFSDFTIFNLNKLDQYILLEKLKNQNVTNEYITIESIQIINSYDVVIKYKNKCNILKKIEKCILCLDDGIDCIPLECAHYLCINLDNNCYSNMIYGLDHKCSICKGEILLSNN